MFGLSSLKRPSSIKAFASDNFINALSGNLKSAKEQMKEKEENADEHYSKILNKALEAIKRFSSYPGFDKNSFDEAADMLAEASKLKSGKAEPYFYLAWLFCFKGNTDKALKYFKVASFINPDLNGLDLLKDEILSSHNLQKPIERKNISNVERIPIASIKNMQKPIEQNNNANSSKAPVDVNNIAKSMYSRFH